MTPRLIEFRAKVEDGRKAWGANVASPYVEAYTAAFDSYQKTLADQRETDKQRAELFVAGASILTGSILMAAVATSSMRALAGRVALQAVCNNNMERTFKAMHAISNNRAMMFALGKLADEAKSRLGKEGEEIVTAHMQNTRSIITSATPLIQHLQLTRMLDTHELCAKRLAEQAEKSGASEANKQAVFAELRRSPLYNPPVRAIDPVRLAPKLELCFYMTSILNSDTLIEWPASGMGMGMGMSAFGAKERSIEVMPSSKQYPNPALPKPSWGVMPAHQSVGIERLGSTVRKRVDEVCLTVRKKKFYGAGSESGSTNDMGKRQELLAAERILTALADETRPTSALEQRL